MTPYQVEQAASWQARLLSDHCSEQDRACFATWLAENEAHQQAFGLVSQIWQSGEFTRRSVSRKFGRRAALSCGLVLGGLTLFGASGADAKEIRTGRHERHRFGLTGMDIEMDACSIILCGPSHGQVTIENGRYALSFYQDCMKIQCSGWTISGGKGRYALDLSEKTLNLAVLEGGLRMGRSDHARIALTEGQAVSLDRLTQQSTVTIVRPDDMLAWREGRAVFRNTPLDQAIAEMARYSDRPARLVSPSLARLRISGVFHTQDPARFFRALPHLLPLRVTFGPTQIEIVKL